MKRGHLIKEEISVYFRMVLRRGVAGKERPRMDGKRKTHGTIGYRRLLRGKGESTLPKQYGNSSSFVDKC